MSQVEWRVAASEGPEPKIIDGGDEVGVGELDGGASELGDGSAGNVLLRGLSGHAGCAAPAILDLMQTIVAMGLSATRQLVTTLASVLVPATENLADAGLADDPVQTMTFGLDKTTYEIDLSPADVTALRTDLAPWVKHAHRIRTPATPTTRRRTSRSTAGAHPAAAIRQWARANGYTVSDRGRLPTAVVQAYQADH